MSIELEQVVSVVGRTVDDEALRAFMESVRSGLAKKLPKQMANNSMKYVTAAKEGLEMGFVPDILHPDYPVVPKTKAAAFPRLSVVWLTKKFGGWGTDALFGLPAEPSEEALRAAFGEPSVFRGVANRPHWRHVVDAERSVIFDASPGANPMLLIDQGRRLGELSAETVLFAAWALERGWLASDFVDEETMAALKSRDATPSALAPGLHRGLWDTHLTVPDAARNLAYSYFHRLPPADGWWRTDLIEMKGGRTDQYSHQEPALDVEDCDWSVVDEVTPVLNVKIADAVSGS